MPTVLVVEDSPVILSALSDSLIDEGWEVLAAATWGDAISVACTFKSDVVLCDVLLSNGKDGLSLRSKLASYGLGHVPFAFMTASKREAAVLAGEIVLLKPFSVSEAIAILSAAISSRAGGASGSVIQEKRLAERER
jgi:two-component system, OmpR family, KDP operon response regulator KdpE